jgi:Tfp pilus assembly protein FimT
VARTEAIKRQQGVSSSAAPRSGAGTAALTCTYDTFRGWFVFQDLNSNWQRDAGEPVIETHTLIDASVTVKPDAKGDIVSFGPSGFANPAGAKVPTATLVMCDTRGVVAVGTGSTGRALFITATGRARATATYAEVHNTALPLVTGGSCP